MNELIKKQLNKCRKAQIPAFDNTTTKIIIPKTVDLDEIELGINECYLIKLEDYILNPPNTFTLHENWNNNIKPTANYYKCEIIQLMGKMVKITGIGYDYNNKTDLDSVWTGWIPRKGFSIIKKL